MVDRRQRLQEILDKIEPGWHVYRPWRNDPNSLCIFQKSSENKEAHAEIPQKWFEDGEDDRIEQAVRNAIANAEVMS